MVQILQTESIILREFTQSDVDEMAPIYSDEEVMKYIGLGGAVGRDGTERMIASFRESYKSKGFGIWGCEDKSSGKLIGHCGFNTLPDGLTEIAYLLDKPFWGKGLATSVSIQTLNYGFNVLNFSEVVALAYPQNAASVRIMQKLGMKHCGIKSYFGKDFVFYKTGKESLEVNS